MLRKKECCVPVRILKKRNQREINLSREGVMLGALQIPS